MKTNLQRWNPFSDFSDFQRNIHNLLPGLWSGSGSSSELGELKNWEPAVDIEEDDKQYLIKADLPDVKKEDVNVTVHEGVLCLSGERTREEETKDKTLHRVERFHGSYERSFRLPEDVDEDKLDAQFKNGVLKITLPKAPNKAKARERAISIHS